MRPAMRTAAILAPALGCVLLAQRAAGQVVWEEGFNTNFLSATAALDLHQGAHVNPSEPPWDGQDGRTRDLEQNFTGGLPPGWYAAVVSWNGAYAKHWGVLRDADDKTEGASSLRLAYASLGATTADIADLYIGTKVPTEPGRRYRLSFDLRMDFMGDFWPSNDDLYRPQRERGWCQYSVVLSGSLADMPSIEDYPPCGYNGYIWCDGEPGCPCAHPLTRYVFYTDGQWHHYDYEFDATNTMSAFVWDFRKNRDGTAYPGQPYVAIGDGYHLDKVVLRRLPVTYGDFDDDGDADLEDFAVFALCFNGPQRRPGLGDACDVIDLDRDADVDLADFQVFLACFNGPNRPVPPACPRF